MKTTIFSLDRKYRYTLWREFGSCSLYEPCRYVQFIGLNPSTADEVQDDPTIRRCVGFAKAWGYQALCMTNIFAFRATDPRDMKIQLDPVGPDNDAHLLQVAKDAGLIIAAWGTHGIHAGRAKAVRSLIPNIQCLGLTKDGHPKHPLYLRADTKPIPFTNQPR